MIVPAGGLSKSASDVATMITVVVVGCGVTGCTTCMLYSLYVCMCVRWYDALE
jgi:hypothetical protein